MRFGDFGPQTVNSAGLLPNNANAYIEERANAIERRITENGSRRRDEKKEINGRVVNERVRGVVRWLIKRMRDKRVAVREVKKLTRRKWMKKAGDGADDLDQKSNI